MELIVERLGKRYGDRWAVRDISFKSGPGLVGLVGPNGAGKTTLMRMLATLLPPTAGSVRWNGYDSQAEGTAIRRVLGYLPQEFGVYPELTGRRFLRYLAAMKGLTAVAARRRVDEVLELVNLEREADRRLSTFSGGMKQRLGIAQAVLNDPELLIVDEPTAGLDPAERARFRAVLSGLTSDRLVILSTHIIGDIEAVAGRLVIMREGTVIADTTSDQLVRGAAGRVWTVTLDAPTALRLQAAYTVSALITQPHGTVVRIVSEARPHVAAVPAEPTLEDAYLLTVGAATPSALFSANANAR